jgi:hypothetical protein
VSRGLKLVCAVLLAAGACAERQIQERWVCGNSGREPPLPVIPLPEAAPVPGLIEVESFHSGDGSRSIEEVAGASGGQRVRTKGAARLRFHILVERAATYRVQLAATAGPREEAGVFLALGGKRPGRPLPDDGAEAPLVDFGLFSLPAGRNVLEVVVSGRAPASVALDWLRFSLEESAPDGGEDAVQVRSSADLDR